MSCRRFIPRGVPQAVAGRGCAAGGATAALLKTAHPGRPGPWVRIPPPPLRADGPHCSGELTVGSSPDSLARQGGGSLPATSDRMPRMRLISDMRLAQGVLRAAWCGVLIGLVGPSATASADAPPVCSDATKTVKARTYGAAAIRVHCTDPESQPLKLALMTRPGHARDVDEMVQD